MKALFFLVCLAAFLCLYAHAQGVCSQLRVRGPCRARFHRFFYNPLTGQCESFYYGGCRGNENNFRTLRDCQRQCERSRTVSSTTDRCSQPKEVGPCRGYLPRFYFDSQTGRCRMFGYGGCQGNDNNFRSEAKCQLACPGTRPISSTTRDPVCSQPKVTGPCRAYFRRYFFNSATGTCERFVYGGCRGNENNFKTEQECLARCA